MDEWIRNFKAGALDMVAATYSHPKNQKELIESTHGRVVRMWRNGESLFAAMEMDDEATDKIDKKFLVSTSVGISPRKDNQGRAIGEVMEHVALTNDAHITRLQPFEEIAAESGTRKVLWLEAQPSGGSAMKIDRTKVASMSMEAMDGMRCGYEMAGDAEGVGVVDEEMKKKWGETYPGKEFPGREKAMEHVRAAAASTPPRALAAEAVQLEAAKKESEALRLQADEQAKRIVSLEATAENAKAMMVRLEAERQEAESASVKSTIESLQRAKFGIPAHAVGPLTMIALEAKRAGGSIKLEADGKTVEKSSYELLLETLKSITVTGLTDNRELGRRGMQPMGGGNEGGEGSAVALETGPAALKERVQVNEWLKSKGRKEIDWSKPTAKDGDILFEAVNALAAEGKIVLEAPKAIGRSAKV
jgi:hypothetical protein